MNHMKILKNLVFSALLIALLTPISFAQKKGEPQVEIPSFTIDETSKQVTYSGVVDQKGNKDVLFDKGFAWAMGYFKNPSNVIREKDKAAGKLMARSRFYYFYTDPKKGTKTRRGTIEYTLKVAFKEGRYRYEVTRINVKAVSYQGIEQWIDANKKTYSYANATYLVQVDEEVNKVIDALKTGMAKEEKGSDEW